MHHAKCNREAIVAQYPSAVLTAAYLNTHSRKGAKMATPKDFIYLPFPTGPAQSEYPSQQQLVEKIKALFGDPKLDRLGDGDPLIGKLGTSS